jgi:hypothetical protein
MKGWILERLSRLGFKSYLEYLKSDLWKNRRTRFFEKNPRRCIGCGEDQGRIDLHHRTYVRIGQELDQDLVPLCRSCHQSLHVATTFGYADLKSADQMIVRRQEIQDQVLESKAEIHDIPPDPNYSPSPRCSRRGIRRGQSYPPFKPSNQ